MKRLHAVIRGRVTGVCYRMFCGSQARSLGLTGWARNLADASVELVAEGPEDKLAALVKACREGPALAEVRELHYDLEEAVGEFARFEIRPDGLAEEAAVLQEKYPPA